jgi:hypothetical protein
MNVRYPNGAVGCVSRNYPDRKWRIVSDDRDGSWPGGRTTTPTRPETLQPARNAIW